MDETPSVYNHGDMIDDLLMVSFDDSLSVSDKTEKVRLILQWVGLILDSPQDY